MCEAAGVDPALVEENDKECGGAQYILKNNTAELWDQIWKSSIPLYKRMIDTAEKYTPKGDIPIQSWTAEMWTTNWMAWKNGIKTKVHKGMDFHWANHRMKNIKHTIFHNTGVPQPNGIDFCRIIHQGSAFKQQLVGKKGSLSYHYVLEIKDTEKNFPDMIW